MSRTVVGLEVTEESIRAVEVRTGRTPTVVASGSVPLPSGAAHDSEVLDADAVALAARQLWTRAGFRSRNVILGLGSRRILVREYTTQAMHPRLLRQALPFQVQDLLPVPIDQAVLDFYPAWQSGDQVTGLLVAAVSETVQELIAAVTKAKLEVETVDLMPFGLARAGASLAAAGETTAMVHITDHTTYVVVVLDGIPRFVRIIPIDIPTTAVRLREAADAEQETGTEAATDPFTAPAPLRSRSSLRAETSLADMSDPAVIDLLRRVRSTVQFYESRPDSAPVHVTHVSGAGAAIPGMHAALGQLLSMPVDVLDVGRLTALKTPIAGELALDLVGTLGIVWGEGL